MLLKKTIIYSREPDDVSFFGRLFAQNLDNLLIGKEARSICWECSHQAPFIVIVVFVGKMSSHYILYRFPLHACISYGTKPGKKPRIPSFAMICLAQSIVPLYIGFSMDWTWIFVLITSAGYTETQKAVPPIPPASK